MTGKCSFCEEPFEGGAHGHNPSPLKPSDELCCDDCCINIVIPERMRQVHKGTPLMGLTLDEFLERHEAFATSDPAETRACSLCGTEFTGYGNSPEPIDAYDERCCDTCAETIVSPLRLNATARILFQPDPNPGGTIRTSSTEAFATKLLQWTRNDEVFTVSKLIVATRGKEEQEEKC